MKKVLAIVLEETDDEQIVVVTLDYPNDTSFTPRIIAVPQSPRGAIDVVDLVLPEMMVGMFGAETVVHKHTTVADLDNDTPADVSSGQRFEA